MYQRKKGLTLIEVLVVISVIALLFSVLGPALKASKQKGTTVACMYNLRQLTLASQVYTQDSDRYPQGFVSISKYPSQPPGKCVGDLSADWYGWWWFHFLLDTTDADYTQDSVLGCPDNQNNQQNTLCGNYGINYSISKLLFSAALNEFYGVPLRPTEIKSPSSVYYLMDSGYTLVSWKAMIQDSESISFENESRTDSFYIPGLSSNKERTINEKQQDDATKGRHRSLINVAYIDGHVDSANAGKWTTYPEDPATSTSSMSLLSWRGN